MPFDLLTLFEETEAAHKALRRGASKPPAHGNYPWIPSPRGSHRPGF